MSVFDKKMVIYLPFDEEDGALSYDHTVYRHDIQLGNAVRMLGIIGKGLMFPANQSILVSQSQVFDVNQDHSISLFAKSLLTDGLPISDSMHWKITFSGIAFPMLLNISTPGGKWVHTGITVNRATNTIKVYLKGRQVGLARTVGFGDIESITLMNSDETITYGNVASDDIRVYDEVLTDSDMMELANIANQRINYCINYKNIRSEFGIEISKSNGVIDALKRKAPLSMSWDDQNGEEIDLEAPRWEPRDITLECFLRAESKYDFIEKVSDFKRELMKAGSYRLMIDVYNTKPLVYEVYMRDGIDIEKAWKPEKMIGTFTLKLREPEPVKRVLKHIKLGPGTEAVTLTLTSENSLKIYWGDGTVDKNVFGDSVTKVHEYTADGEYFIIICGVIEEITNFSTNGIIIWNNLS